MPEANITKAYINDDKTSLDKVADKLELLINDDYTVELKKK
ncbi:hypothetical protein RV02_GL003910 [Enterococcus gilvus]|nr:hypothetical protein RV02_GL003910 [Enterococcus gilvus]